MQLALNSPRVVIMRPPGAKGVRVEDAPPGGRRTVGEGDLLDCAAHEGRRPGVDVLDLLGGFRLRFIAAACASRLT